MGAISRPPARLGRGTWRLGQCRSRRQQQRQLECRSTVHEVTISFASYLFSLASRRVPRCLLIRNNPRLRIVIAGRLPGSPAQAGLFCVTALTAMGIEQAWIGELAGDVVARGRPW